MVPRNSKYGNYRLKIEYLTGNSKTEYADSKGGELKTLLIFRKYHKEGVSILIHSQKQKTFSQFCCNQFESVCIYLFSAYIKAYAELPWTYLRT
jgi:hypothetical protein